MVPRPPPHKLVPRWPVIIGLAVAVALVLVALACTS
jgi:hypothetical protein